MKRTMILLALVLTACSAPRQDNPTHVAPAIPADGDDPFSVILFIGDGAGMAYWTAARFSYAPLAVDRMPVTGLVDTQASNSRITDSAAGATAYAAGVRTFNGAIGVDADSTPVRTVLELAESRGMSTGLVATSTITHATPASFAAHVPSRHMHDAIAADMAERDIDVLLGGGKQFFDPATREDGADLLSRVVRNGAYVETAADFRGLDLDTVQTLVGFFADDNPPPVWERELPLAELTRTGLDLLSRDREGFFLMVEGSQIDWQGHDNAPLQDVVAEVRDFDMAIAEALAFQQERPNTLVLVVADHETGGLSLVFDSTGAVTGRYTTTGHTGEMVPLFAAGPGAGAFTGVLDNHVVGQLLLRMVADGGPGHARNAASIGTGASWSHSSPSRPR